MANVPSNLGIPLIQIERSIDKINALVEPELAERLAKDFGIEVSGLDISDVEPDKTSEGYRQLMRITRDIEAKTVQAQGEINIKNLHDQQRINVENLEETLRIQREEAQRSQRMSTEFTNLSAFQLEKQAEVGVAGAAALGQMGANGTTSLGGAEGSGGGFDPAAMMIGIAMGGAVGQNIAGMMNSMMGGMQGSPNSVSSNGAIAPSVPASAGQVDTDVQVAQHETSFPPPIPQQRYYVGVNGVPSGPFEIETLKQMLLKGNLSKKSYVWKPGMEDWLAAGAVADLTSIFEVRQTSTLVPGMPPIPKSEEE